MPFIIRKLEPKTESDELLQKYIDFSEILYQELHPTNQLPSRELSTQSILVKISGREYIRKIVLDENRGEVIGRVIMEFYNEDNPDYEKNKHISFISIDIRSDYDQFKIGNILLDKAITFIDERGGIEFIETCCFREWQWKFWKSHNAKLALEGAQNRLYLKDVDWEMMEFWRNDGHKRAKEESIDLVSFQKCPEEIIVEYTELYSEIMSLVPLENFEYQLEKETPKTRREKEERFSKLGYRWYSLVTKEKDGKFSGLTEIFYHDDRPKRVEQELTGVSPSNRGRGVGKWLKAEMLDFVKSNFPDAEFLETGNADSNAAMLSINERMGFKLYLTEKCYTIKLKEFKKTFKVH